MTESKEAVLIAKLVLTIQGQRHVFAALIPAGTDPMEMTLGQWRAAPALSGAALCEDFFSRLLTGERE